jgi:hypothetical protein
MGGTSNRWLKGSVTPHAPKPRNGRLGAEESIWRRFWTTDCRVEAKTGNRMEQGARRHAGR